jgi:ABC-type ATPase with predicted acetyltransferase domain
MMNHFKSAVKQIRSTPSETRLVLENGMTFLIHPHIYLKVNDSVEGDCDQDVLVELKKHIPFVVEGQSNFVKIVPPYSETEVVAIPPHDLSVTFRERLKPQDWRAAKLLEQFHYRGQGLNKIVGRRAVLVIEAEGHGIIGYGVLSSTVAAARPRFQLFKTNFKNQMETKLINRLVRIPRVVIHPEFRGMGLGVLMAKHLVAYASEYWDINGYKPIMVEVIASMTEYHQFFQRAGFRQVGITLGYKRGIIPVYGSGSWESRPNHNGYNFFGHQNSKPYLVYPLSEEVRKMVIVKEHVEEMEKKLVTGIAQLDRPIRFQNLSVTYRASNGLTPRAIEVKDAFSVDAGQMYSPVLKGFSLTIVPGDVVLFTGASGSGKSTIVKLLTESVNEIGAAMQVSGTLEGIDLSQVARLDVSWDENLPLIEQIGNSTKEAIAILNSVGLAEAHLYVKRCSQISEGQKYRFAVAKLCDSKKPIWVADEFASTLDPLTAAIVAKGLRRLALQCGATVILAAPHIDHFVDSLLPNKLVNLRWGGLARIYSLSIHNRRRGKGMEVWAENNGAEGLSSILIRGFKEGGIQDNILEVEYLSRGESTPRKLIELPQLQWYSALVITSREGVGDIIRFQ